MSEPLVVSLPTPGPGPVVQLGDFTLRPSGDDWQIIAKKGDTWHSLSLSKTLTLADENAALKEEAKKVETIEIQSQNPLDESPTIVGHVTLRELKGQFDARGTRLKKYYARIQELEARVKELEKDRKIEVQMQSVFDGQPTGTSHPTLRELKTLYDDRGKRIRECLAKIEELSGPQHLLLRTFGGTQTVALTCIELTKRYNDRIQELEESRKQVKELVKELESRLDREQEDMNVLEKHIDLGRAEVKKLQEELTSTRAELNTQETKMVALENVAELQKAKIEGLESDASLLGPDSMDRWIKILKASPQRAHIIAERGGLKVFVGLTSTGSPKYFLGQMAGEELGWRECNYPATNTLEVFMGTSDHATRLLKKLNEK
jgi:DNA repair exonuclease SbcCD ATPase subunit